MKIVVIQMSSSEEYYFGPFSFDSDARDFARSMTKKYGFAFVANLHDIHSHTEILANKEK